MPNIDRALAYLEKLPAAIEGSGGHKATWEAVLACRRFGLSDGEMWQAMSWFNENRCQPPWSEKDLRHKMANAANVQVSKPLGQAFGRQRAPKPVTADALRERMAKRSQAPQEAPAPEIPVYLRTEAEEELWWERVLAERGIEDPAPWSVDA